MNIPQYDANEVAAHIEGLDECECAIVSELVNHALNELDQKLDRMSLFESGLILVASMAMLGIASKDCMEAADMIAEGLENRQDG